MSDWTLHYWIRGQPLDAWHTIQVPPKIGTFDLKQLIYDIHHESPIGRSIRIYKVPDNKPVLLGHSHTLGALTLEQLCFVEFGDVTFEPPILGNQLHLVINASFDICCWLRGADISGYPSLPSTTATSAFTIHASMTDTILKLKLAFKERLYALGYPDIPAFYLRPYKILPSDSVATLLIAGEGQALEGHQFLGDVFNDVPFSAIPCVAIDCVDYVDSVMRFWFDTGSDICEDMEQLTLCHHSNMD